MNCAVTPLISIISQSSIIFVYFVLVHEQRDSFLLTPNEFVLLERPTLAVNKSILKRHMHLWVLQCRKKLHNWSFLVVSYLERSSSFHCYAWVKAKPLNEEKMHLRDIYISLIQQKILNNLKVSLVVDIKTVS